MRVSQTRFREIAIVRQRTVQNRNIPLVRRNLLTDTILPLVQAAIELKAITTGNMQGSEPLARALEDEIRQHILSTTGFDILGEDIDHVQHNTTRQHKRNTNRVK